MTLPSRLLWLKALLYLVLTLYAVITLIPFLWALSASFKPLSEIITGELNFFTQNFTLDNYKMFTLPLGLNSLKGQYISYWNYIMAASMIFTLPALGIFAFVNRYFIQSATFTGGKG